MIGEGSFCEELQAKARAEIDHIVFGYPQEDKKEE